MEVTSAEHQEPPIETSESMYISLNAAAKKWGKSKGNISTLAKSGKLQWHSQPNGERKLFLPELAAYFGPPPEHRNPVSEHAVVTMEERVANTRNTPDISRLEAELQAARELLEEVRSRAKREAELLEEQLERERTNADHWRRMAEETQKMLPPPANSNRQEQALVTTNEHPEHQKRGFWPFRRKASA
jgi:hypothetical protein